MSNIKDFISKLRNKPFIKSIINDLGGEVFVVGGATRDLILNKPNKDIDLIVRNIPIDKLILLLGKFGRLDVVGKSFGVLKFIDNDGIDFDIALPRKEKPNGEGGYRGFEIQSDENLPIEDDLIRRDAKMNAMAININTGKFIDPLDGLGDIEKKQISATNPEAFSDDPLRMLRIISFASRFGFTIEPRTMQMIINNAAKITEIAPERILIELDKIITKGDPLIGVQLLSISGLFKQIFGNEIKPSQIGRRDFSGIRTMAELLFLMMNGVVQNPAEFYLTRFSTEDAKRDKTYKELQALDLAFNSNLVDQQMSPIKARSIVHNMFITAPQTLQSKILPEKLQVAAQELLAGKYPKTVNELAVNGNDLMDAGLRGKEIGDMQKSMLMKIYNDDVRNTREELLSLVNQTPEQLKEEPVKRVSYSAVVLDDQSRTKLIQVFTPMIPEGWEVVAHHMTIKLGELPEESQEKYDLVDDKIVSLNVIDYAINSLVFAVGVEGYTSKNPKPHITIAVNRNAGGKPVMSNKLTDWKPLGFPMILTGKVSEEE